MDTDIDEKPFCVIHGYTMVYDRKSGLWYCYKCEGIEEREDHDGDR